MTAASPFPGNRAERSRSAHAVPRTLPSQLSSAVLPAGVVTLICLVAAGIVLFGNPSAATFRVVVAGVTCGTLVLLVVVYIVARAARLWANRVDAEVRAARQAAHRGQAELQQMVDQLTRGEHPVPLTPPPARVTDGEPFRMLVSDIEQAQYQAAQGVLRVADRVQGGRADRRVEIFVNLARRMQSLVHREIEMLDDLEAKVEDPELLKGLFTVDHLATRQRRQSESLAVLGGSSSRRQWTRQVTMHEVLRAAIAEVEHYSRVKVVPPVEGVIRGGAVTDVIHLIAELVENATKFSAPHTIALLRAQHVSAGLAIEVEDRGLGMLPADQRRMNELLADPTRMDLDELLRDGRIGLFVVATLARRHGIRVQLQNNIYGGTQAVVVLPKVLLDLTDDHERTAVAADDREADLRLALVPTSASTSASSGGPAADWPASTGPATRPSGEHMPSAAPATGRPVPGMSSAPAPWATDGMSGAWATDSGPVRPQETASRPPEAPARPPLPRRQPQASPILPAPDKRGDGSTTRSPEPPADQMTGLMADFLRGVRSAEETDPSTES